MTRKELQKELHAIEQRLWKLYLYTESEFQNMTSDIGTLVDELDDGLEPELDT